MLPKPLAFLVHTCDWQPHGFCLLTCVSLLVKRCSWERAAEVQAVRLLAWKTTVLSKSAQQHQKETPRPKDKLLQYSRTIYLLLPRGPMGCRVLLGLG